jgi:mannose-6-phosphate isomerase-like protein (cupin superfamily)
LIGLADSTAAAKLVCELSMKKIITALSLAGLFVAGIVGAEKDATKPAIPGEWLSFVTDAADLPIEKSPWGTLQWVCNAKLLPGAAQTVGLAQVYPGKTNVLHYHPNCEEVLHVLSGRGVQIVDGHSIELKTGMTIRIPSGAKHQLANTGSEPLLTLISFSSGDRKTVFLDNR